MWLSTWEFGADLSKDFSKKVLEFVLDTEILAPLEVLDFGKDKTPKNLVNTGFSASFIVCYFRAKSVNFRWGILP